MRYIKLTYQNSAGGGLPGDKFACPILCLRHEGALELLLALTSRLLLLLFRVIGREFWLFAAAEESERSPQQDDGETSKESEDTGQ